MSVAVSVGEIEATLKLKNEMSTQVNAALKAAERDLAAVQKALDGIDPKQLQTMGQAGQVAADKMDIVTKAVKGVGQATAEQQAKLAAWEARMEGIDRASAEAANSTKKVTTASEEFAAGMGKVLAGGAAVAALTALATQALAAGAALTQASAVTGVATDRLDRFARIGAPVSTSLSQISNGLETMEKKLGNNDAGAIGALQDLGFNIGALKAGRVDVVFEEIARAVSDIEDPFERAAVAAKVFGTTDLQPFMDELQASGEDVGQWSQKTIENINRVARAWENLKTLSLSTAGEILGRLGDLPGLIDTMSKQGPLGGAKSEIQRMLDNWITGAGASSGPTEEAKIRVPLPAGPKVIDGMRSAQDALKAYEDQQRKLEATTKRSSAARDAAAKKDQQLLDEQREYTLRNRQAIAEAMKKEEDRLEKLADKYAWASAEIQGRVKDISKSLIRPADLNTSGFDINQILGIGNGKSVDLSGLTAPAREWAAAWGSAITDTSRAFEQLANIAGDDFGGVAKAVGETMAAMNVGAHAGTQLHAGWERLGGENKNLAEGFGQVALSALQAAAAIDQATRSGSDAERILGGAAAGASAGMAFGWQGAAVGAGVGAAAGWLRSMRDGRDLIKEFGNAFDSTVTDALSGFDELHAKLGELGDAGEELWANLMRVDAGDQHGAELAIRAIQEALAGPIREAQFLDAAMTKYGLTLESLHDPATRFMNDVTGVLNEIDALSGKGFSTETLATSMAAPLNALLAAARETGEQLPATLGPYLEQLARSGGVTDELARKLLDLPAKNIAPWREMEEVAKEFNIDIGALGLSFTQSKLIENAETLAGKFNLLVGNGADVTSVLEGMDDAILEIAKRAQSTGLELPASFKPVLEAMQKAGKFTEEAGLKLDDLSSFRFEATVEDHLEDLVDVIREMVSALRDDLPAAAAAAGRALAGVNGPGGGGGHQTTPGEAGPERDANAAKGGYFPAKAGGWTIGIGEAGEGEYVIPESKMGRVGGSGGANVSLTVNLSNASFRDRDSVREMAGLVADELANVLYARGL